MNPRKFLRIAGLIVFGLILLVLDFISKAFLYQLLSREFSIPVFQNFLGITFEISLALNRGAAWGMLADFQTVLLILRIAAICGIVAFLIFRKRSQTMLPFVLILAGAIGNVIDSFYYGYVIDFLHFSFGSYHFAIFNFADSYITIGVVLLFLSNLITKNKDARKKNLPSSGL